MRHSCANVTRNFVIDSRTLMRNLWNFVRRRCEHHRLSSHGRVDDGLSTIKARRIGVATIRDRRIGEAATIEAVIGTTIIDRDTSTIGISRMSATSGQVVDVAAVMAEHARAIRTINDAISPGKIASNNFFSIFLFFYLQLGHSSIQIINYGFHKTINLVK